MRTLAHARVCVGRGRKPTARKNEFSIHKNGRTAVAVSWRKCVVSVFPDFVPVEVGASGPLMSKMDIDAIAFNNGGRTRVRIFVMNLRSIFGLFENYFAEKLFAIFNAEANEIQSLAPSKFTAFGYGFFRVSGGSKVDSFSDNDGRRPAKPHGFCKPSNVFRFTPLRRKFPRQDLPILKRPAKFRPIRERKIAS